MSDNVSNMIIFYGKLTIDCICIKIALVLT